MQINVLEYLEETTVKYGDKKAYIDESTSVTFNELLYKSKQVGSYISHHYNIEKKTIAVLLPKSIVSLIIFHGITYSGNIYVPIDINQPLDRINNIFKTLEPFIIIVNDKTKELVKNIYLNSNIVFYSDLFTEDVDEKAIIDIRRKHLSTDPLYILYTSGSTGIPKGVVINHQSVIDYIDWVQETFQFSSDDIFGNQAPFYFDNSVLDIYTTLKVGSSLYIIPEYLFSFKKKLLETLELNEITVIFWVPSLLISIANSKLFETYKSKLKTILFAGEVMQNKSLNIWRKYIPNALYANLYGPTEITVDCLYYIVDREFNDDEPLPIGYACRNTEILIINNNKLVEGNEIGEIYVRGISLSMGYYNDNEKTNEVFVQNPLHNKYNDIVYKTGDLAYYNTNGEIIYVGRKDTQIKHSGYRIELGEIETAAVSMEEIINACVVYNQNTKQIILYYTSEKQLEEIYIKDYIANKVPKYAVPVKIIYLKDLPMTPNGKIDRVTLKKHI